ncbi:ABC transporter ATP-binding protein [Planktotalea arctica]|uniref:ABC transporter ATP-binding protein n=1 Tax=Planktotalea arctica TaxID=1481893 RepID=UPI00321B5EF6
MNEQATTERLRVLALSNVSKSYETSFGPFHALRNISLDVEGGDLLAILGKSGSGKSTLVNMMTGLDSLSSGAIWSCASGGKQVEQMDQDALARWRGLEVGVVFQFFQLLPTLTVAENAILPMEFCNCFPRKEQRDRAMANLSNLGIAEQADKLPHDLSGGQQQRAAIARALANDPAVLVADEPTGNLDSETSAEVMELFTDLCKAGKAVVMVTHERDLSKYFNKSILLADGEIAARTGGV